MPNKTKKDKLTILFEKIPVRRVWVEKEERWYFAVKDVVGALSESSLYIKDYIKRICKRDNLSKEWKQITTPLYIETKSGKQNVNCANIDGILRIIKIMFSRKAKLFKKWMAEIGYEKLQESVDPESELIFAALLKISKIKVPKRGRVSKKKQEKI